MLHAVVMCFIKHGKVHFIETSYLMSSAAECTNSDLSHDAQPSV